MRTYCTRLALLLPFTLVAAATAQAQTCASPLLPALPPQSGSANTCSSSNDIGTFCGLFPSPDRDVVFRYIIDGSRTATAIAVTNGTANWNLRAFLLQGSCGVAATCADSVDDNGEGGFENFTNLASLPAGTYYLVVDTSGDPSTATCGTFTWAANGRLPVQLKTFSID